MYDLSFASFLEIRSLLEKTFLTVIVYITYLDMEHG